MGTKNALQDRQVETIDDLRQLEVISWNAPQVAIWDAAKAAQHQRGCPWDQAHLGSEPALPVSMLARTQHRPLHQCGSAPRLDLGPEQRSSSPTPPWAGPGQSPVRALARDPIASAAWATTYPRTPGDRQAAGLIACTPAAGLDAAGAREGGGTAPVALHPVGMMRLSQRIGDGEGPVSETGLAPGLDGGGGASAETTRGWP